MKGVPSTFTNVIILFKMEEKKLILLSLDCCSFTESMSLVAILLRVRQVDFALSLL